MPLYYKPLVWRTQFWQKHVISRRTYKLPSSAQQYENCACNDHYHYCYYQSYKLHWELSCFLNPITVIQQVNKFLDFMESKDSLLSCSQQSTIGLCLKGDEFIPHSHALFILNPLYYSLSSMPVFQWSPSVRYSYQHFCAHLSSFSCAPHLILVDLIALICGLYVAWEYKVTSNNVYLISILYHPVTTHKYSQQSIPMWFQNWHFNEFPNLRL